MIVINVKGKEYKLDFRYRYIAKTNLIYEVLNKDYKSPADYMNGEISGLVKLLLTALQAYHTDEFGYNDESGKEAAIDKVYDLIDDYEDESTAENPKNSFELYKKLNEELSNKGFLSRMMTTIEEAAKKATEEAEKAKKRK